MKKDIQIHIPKPCHEDWHQMAPVDKGRFCQSCAKQVVDFSVMSDQQVLQYISKAAGGMCGRFANDQLQRSLLRAKQEKKKMWWLAAAVPLMMVFGKAGAQKKTHKNKPKENIIKLSHVNNLLGEVVFTSKENNDDDDERDSYKPVDAASMISKITVWRKKGQTTFTVTGKIEEARNNAPIPYATILLKNTRTGTFTDDNGSFKLSGTSIENHNALCISSVGFESKDIEITLEDSEEVRKEVSYNIHGTVVDNSGISIPFATIKTKKGGQSIITDADGVFNLTFPLNQQQNTLIVSGIGLEEKQVLVSTKDTGGIIIKCQQMSKGLTEVVVGKMRSCSKPKAIDTIPALIRKVFHAEAFTIYPNPAQKGQSISIDTKKNGDYTIQVFDNSGKLLQVKEFNAIEGATLTTLDIPVSFAAGIYYIWLVDEKTKKQYTDKIVVR